MILFEDGTIILLRRGHIRGEFKLDHKSEINLNKHNRFSLKAKGSGGTEVIECPEAEVWVSIIKSIQKLNIVNNSK